MKYILGIDVGGTKIAAGLVNSKLVVSKVKVLPTSQTNLNAQLLKLVESFNGFSAIGLGVPSPEISADGTVSVLPNVKGFKKTNLKKLLSDKFNVPVSVMNDSQAFTLAESVAGSAKGYKKVAGVIIGTGIGGGVFIDKKMYAGTKYSKAGEWGMIAVKPKVTLEQVMHRLGKFTKAEQSLPFVEVLIAFILRVLNPEAIVFGGGRINLPGIDKVLQKAKKQVAPSSKVVVKRFSLKYPGIIGAALPLLKK